MSKKVSREIAKAALGVPTDKLSITKRSFPLTRRQFMLSIGASLVVNLPIAKGALASGLRIERRLEPPGLAEEKRALLVHLGKDSWEIDPKLFSTATRLKYKHIDGESFYTIQLKDAIYPGMELECSFLAEIYPRAGNWQIRITFNAVGTAQEFILSEWMRSSIIAAESAVYSGDLRTGREPISIGNGTSSIIPLSNKVRWRVDRKFISLLDSPAGLSFRSPRVDLNLQSVELALSEKTVLEMPAWVTGPFTNIALQNASTNGNKINLTRIGKKQSVRLTFGSLPIAAIWAFGSNHQRDGIIQLGGQDVAGTLVVHGNGSGPTGARVQLKRWVLIGRLNAIGRSIKFAANVSSLARGIEADTISVVIGGESSELVEQEFTDRPIAELVFRAHIYSAHVPVADASGADITFVDRIIQVRFGPLPRTAPYQATVDAATFPTTSEAQLYIGPDTSRFETPLENAELRLRRSTDSFDLAFSFQRYLLRVENGTTKLIKRRALLKSSEAKLSQPRIIVYFSPQHIFEEAFQTPNLRVDDSELRKPKEQTINNDNKYKHIKRHEISNKQPDLARTKLSGRSRLVFEDKPVNNLATSEHRNKVFEKELSIDVLTDWTDLALVVNKRALCRNTSLQQQLDTVEIKPEDTRAQAESKVKSLILEHGEPALDETSIEPIYRLLISPDNKARFKVPSTPPDPVFPEVWTAELANPKEVAVRALWARGMSLDFIGKEGSYTAPPYDFDFAGSLNDNDRREIVAMSSFYGLAALRRLNGKPSIDDPNGMVFLPSNPSDPSKTYDYLRPKVDPQEGVILARPFESFKLRLGRVADVDAFWKGEPPAAYKGDNDPFFAPAFTIERYLHRVTQGRDAFVEVTYKGFLFPLGHRAAFLKVTYRDFKPYLNKDDGDPTAYLIQEMFIVCRNPRKTYKAYNQPYDGNDFPCKTIDILTTQTGSLAEPDVEEIPIKNNKGRDQNRPLGKVFWPKLNGSGADVFFEYRIDEKSDQVARSPLLFVDNAAAHDPEAVKSIIDYYNNELESNQQRVTMEHGGAVCRYATENKRGDCSFKTFDWKLKARGRVVATVKGEQEIYTMDAFMEGQDQPPFYPVLDSAFIQIEPLERLTGKRGVKTEVAFNRNYVHHGFDPTRNPSEIYLDIVSPDTSMDSTDSGGSTGGVATISAAFAGLSRKIGPVGGRLTTDIAKPSGSPLESIPLSKFRSLIPSLFESKEDSDEVIPTVGGTAPRIYDMSAAEAGRFDPIEYLCGSVKDAKLLGIVPLKDVLKAALISTAPKLLEKTNHGVQAFNEKIDIILKKLLPILSDGGNLVVGAIEKAEKEIGDSLRNISPKVTLKDLYPELARSFSNARAVAKDVAEFGSFSHPSDAQTLASAQHYADAFKDAAEDLLHILEGLARNPVPSVIGETLVEIQKSWQLVRNLFENPIVAIQELVDKLLSETADGLLEQICDAAFEDDLFEALFGRLDLGPEFAPKGLEKEESKGEERKETKKQRENERLICRRALQNPADVLPHLQEALFFDVFAEPLMRTVHALRRIEGNGAKLIRWSRQTVATCLNGALRRGTAYLDETIFAENINSMIEDLDKDVKKIFEREPENRIISEIERSIDRIFNAHRARLEKQLDDLKMTLQIDLEKAEKEVQKHVIAEVQGTITPAMARKYEQLISKRQLIEVTLNETVNLAKTLADHTLVRNLVKTLQAEIKKEFERAINERAQIVATIAKEQADGAAKRIIALVSDVLDVVIGSGSVHQIVTTASQIEDWCKEWTGDFGNSVEAITFGLVSDDAIIAQSLFEVETGLKTANDAIGRLVIPQGDPAGIRDAISAASASLTRHVAALREMCSTLAQLRTKWADLKSEHKNELCSTPKLLITPVGRILDLRSRCTATIMDALTSANELIEAQSNLPDALKLSNLSKQLVASNNFSLTTNAGEELLKINQSAEATINALLDLLDHVSTSSRISGNSTVWQGVEASMRKLAKHNGEDEKECNSPGNDARLNQRKCTIFKAIADLKTAAKTLSGELQAAKSDSTIAVNTARKMVIFAIKQDRQVASIIMQTALEKTAVEAALAKTTVAIAKDVAGLLLKPHENINRQMQGIIDLVEKTPALRTLLARDAVDNLESAKKAIEVDVISLLSLKGEQQVDKVVIEASKLVDRWKLGQSGVELTFEVIRHVFEVVASGNFAALIDIDIGSLEKKIKEQIVGLVPTQISLSYDFDSELSSFPTNDPVFEMDRQSYGSEYEQTYKDEKDKEIYPQNDLVLKTMAEIDLMTGNRRIIVDGRLRAFKLNLVGRGLDLITIHFKGVNFGVRPGEATRFYADISKVRIGALLSFLTVIQYYLSSGDNKNGIYHQVRFLPPEVEVGYRYHQPLVTLGSLQLINIGFQVGARLPIDDRQAEFFASLSSRDYPFLIAQPPYGGGGFFALRATARGIVDFEVQLEFGFVGAIEYDLLEAQARATVGIYLQQTAGRQVLEGFFHAIGEGHVGCFGVSVNIEIKTRQESDSSMAGSARYQYSFSVGLFEIDFEVTTGHRQEGSGGEEAKYNTLASGGEHAMDSEKAYTFLSATTEPKNPEIKVKSLRKERQWKQYKQYLEI